MDDSKLYVLLILGAAGCFLHLGFLGLVLAVSVHLIIRQIERSGYLVARTLLIDSGPDEEQTAARPDPTPAPPSQEDRVAATPNGQPADTQR
ncbi:MAG: hypothetical protein ACOCXJ_05510 [Planctomycetota bacterium]